MTKYRPVFPLPPWVAENQRDNDWMLEWGCSRLFDIFEADFEHPSPKRPRPEDDDRRSADEWWDEKHDAYARLRPVRLEAAIEAADRGDIEPLQSLRLMPARFVRLPKKKRGERYNRAPEWSDPHSDQQYRLARAIEDLAVIRALWKKHYQRNHRPSGATSAAKIAAEFWRVDERQVRRGNSPASPRSSSKTKKPPRLRGGLR